ncbi:MAG: hypothetical protein JST26_03150 [Bacteroidetes bacterium]|nr:hypothetical protein [Bacteroidota bacterium]
MTIKSIFLLLACSPFLFSCTKSITIHVNPDGSAQVQYLLKYDNLGKADSAVSRDEQRKKRDTTFYFYKKAFSSSEISDFDCRVSRKLNPRVRFRIAHLDSVARFLDLESDSVEYFIFTKPHQVILDAGMGDTAKVGSNDSKEDLDFLEAMRFDLTLYTPEKIKKVTNESGLPVKVSGRKFYIKTTRSRIAHSGKRNRIILEY